MFVERRLELLSFAGGWRRSICKYLSRKGTEQENILNKSRDFVKSFKQCTQAASHLHLSNESHLLCVSQSSGRCSPSLPSARQCQTASEGRLSITPTLPMVANAALWAAARGRTGSTVGAGQHSAEEVGLHHCPPLPSDHCRGDDGRWRAFCSSSCPADVCFLAQNYVYF